MMKPLSLTLMFLVLPVTATAECIDVRALAAFVAAQTGLEGLPDCLTLTRADYAPLPGMMLSQAGAYDPATDRIALAPDLNLNSALGQSYLLHELVHMAQFRNAVPAACPAEREAQAYAVQTAFLRAQGEGREALLLTLATAALTSCHPLPSDY